MKFVKRIYGTLAFKFFFLLSISIFYLKKEQMWRKGRCKERCATFRPHDCYSSAPKKSTPRTR